MNLPFLSLMVATSESLHNPKRLLASFLVLLVLRRHARACTYDHMMLTWPWLFQEPFCLVIKCTTHAEHESSVEELHLERSFFEILKTMKLNIEDTDACTQLQQAFWSNPARGGMTLSGKLLVSLAMGFFGSRLFLTTLTEQMQTTLLGSKSAVARAIASVVCECEHPSLLFSASFNPARIHKSKLLKCKDILTAQRQTMKMWKDFQKICSQHFALRRSRRHVASSLGRKFGSFTGKNLYQILSRASLEKFLGEPGKVPYTETGPGARTCINWLEGWPKTWNVLATGQAHADVYSELCVKWMTKWQCLCRDVLGADGGAGAERLQCTLKFFDRLDTNPEHPCFLPEELQGHVTFFLTQDVTAFQFHLCELSKIIHWIQHESVVHERGYWERQFHQKYVKALRRWPNIYDASICLCTQSPQLQRYHAFFTQLISA